MATKLRDRTPLPLRVRRIVTNVKVEHRKALERFVEIMYAIEESPNLSAARFIAANAADGLIAGTVGYAKVSTLLSETSVMGFCPDCATPLYGASLSARDCAMERLEEDCGK